MRKNVCASTARREIRISLWAGAAALAGGVFFLCLDLITGEFWDLRNLVTNKAIEAFLIIGGVYILYRGLRGLFNLDTTDICLSIRPQLRAEEKHLTAKEMLALVDQDLECALDFAGGRVLVGEEWLFLCKSMGTPIIRLENIHRIEHRVTKNHGLYLDFKDQQGHGPTVGVSSIEAGVIEAYLKNHAPNLIL
ncbi:MAG: hypothetical protein HFF84_04765 [Oscillibacter sp.]|nr:hypothetical protein [Oscillibacter sp.]